MLTNLFSASAKKLSRDNTLNVEVALYDMDP